MDADETAYCLNDHTHGPAVGERPTGVVKDMPTLALITGDPEDATAVEVELLCEECAK